MSVPRYRDDMATYRRECIPGATWFFTVAAYRRQRLLTEPAVIAALRDGMRTVRAAHPFNVIALVVLPDHLHAIWSLPQGDADFAVRWSLLKRHVSRCARPWLTVPRSASLCQRGELGLWQRRFWEHRIRDEQDMDRHLDYVHYNPVKHGYVRQARDWPHSSFHHYLERGCYPADWGIAHAPPDPVRTR